MRFVIILPLLALSAFATIHPTPSYFPTESTTETPNEPTKLTMIDLMAPESRTEASKKTENGGLRCWLTTGVNANSATPYISEPIYTLCKYSLTPTTKAIHLEGVERAVGMDEAEQKYLISRINQGSPVSSLHGVFSFPGRAHVKNAVSGYFCQTELCNVPLPLPGFMKFNVKLNKAQKDVVLSMFM